MITLILMSQILHILTKNFTYECATCTQTLFTVRNHLQINILLPVNLRVAKISSLFHIPYCRIAQVKRNYCFSRIPLKTLVLIHSNHSFKWFYLLLYLTDEGGVINVLKLFYHRSFQWSSEKRIIPFMALRMIFILQLHELFDTSVISWLDEEGFQNGSSVWKDSPDWFRSNGLVPEIWVCLGALDAESYWTCTGLCALLTGMFFIF